MTQVFCSPMLAGPDRRRTMVGNDRSAPLVPRRPHHAQGRRHRSRHHQLRRLVPRGRRAGGHPQRGGRTHHARRSSPSPRPARSSSARWPSARPSPTRTGRSARSSATWASRLEDAGHRRQALHAPGDLGPRAHEAEAGRRVLPRRHRHPGGHHRAGLLRRRAAHRHEGGGPDRRPRGPADHQRADRRRARLWPRQGQPGRDGPRVRPRWGHVRRVDPRDRRGRLRGQVDPRRHPARR